MKLETAMAFARNLSGASVHRTPVDVFSIDSFVVEIHGKVYIDAMDLIRAIEDCQVELLSVEFESERLSSGSVGVFNGKLAVIYENALPDEKMVIIETIVGEMKAVPVSEIKDQQTVWASAASASMFRQYERDQVSNVMTTLRSENRDLRNKLQAEKGKVAQLSDKIDELEKENNELKMKLKTSP